MAIALIVSFVLTFFFGVPKEEMKESVETEQAKQKVKEVEETKEALNKYLSVNAPFDRTVNTVFPTKHTYGLTSDQGLDKVQLEGKHFECYIENKIGCMVLGLTNYPRTCSPDDSIATMLENRKAMMFTDVHMRGYYPSYAIKTMEQENVVLNIEPSDKEILKNTCDFLSFSYYMSKCIAINPQDYEKGQGNLTTGVKNPYLQASDCGWQIDPKGLRIILKNIL